MYSAHEFCEDERGPLTSFFRRRIIDPGDLEIYWFLKRGELGGNLREAHAYLDTDGFLRVSSPDIELSFYLFLDG